MKLLILVDTKEYAFSEVYQHQLHETLRQEHDCTYVELHEMKNATILDHYNVVYCALKIRTLINNLQLVASYVKDTQVIVQDYDPWTVLADNAPYYGGYHKINSTLNVLAFFIPNKFWCSVANGVGLNAECFQLGMLQRYCDDTSWEKRSVLTDFRGSSRPARESGFKRLCDSGVLVKWSKDKIYPYGKFLSHLSNVKIWIHNENEPISIANQLHAPRMLWPKAVEVLSRGCFLIRDHDDEADYYGISSMPTAFLFKEESEALHLYNEIMKMQQDELDHRIKLTVDMIRKRDYYKTISDKISTWLR